MQIKYILYAIATIRDVINYNYFEDITEDVMKRMEKELALIEDVEDTPYTKEMYSDFHMDLLKLNMNTLPTIDRLKIDAIGIDGEEAQVDYEIEKPPENVEELFKNFPESQQPILKDMWNLFREGGINPRTGK